MNERNISLRNVFHESFIRCYLILANVMQSAPQLEFLLVIDCQDGNKLFILQLHVRTLTNEKRL